MRTTGAQTALREAAAHLAGPLSLRDRAGFSFQIASIFAIRPPEWRRHHAMEEVIYSYNPGVLQYLPDRRLRCFPLFFPQRRCALPGTRRLPCIPGADCREPALRSRLAADGTGAALVINGTGLAASWGYRPASGRGGRDQDLSCHSKTRQAIAFASKPPAHVMQFDVNRKHCY